MAPDGSPTTAAAADRSPRPTAEAIGTARRVVTSPGTPLPKALHDLVDPMLAPSRVLDPFGPGDELLSGPVPLERVRVHTDARAQAAAMSLGARAFTLGDHVGFGPGQYKPDTSEGRHLIAHELAHVARSSRSGTIFRAAWASTHADERTATGDRFGSQTFETVISSLSGRQGTVAQESISVSVFVPSRAPADQNKIHVFFGPGAAVESGLGANSVGMNAVMTHGFRASTDASAWITIGVPGQVEPDGTEGNAFHAIDVAGIQACLRAAGRSTVNIDAIRLSAHSRGYRGLSQTISRRLVSPTPEKVVIFDAAYGTVSTALAGSGVRPNRTVAYNLGGHQLTAPGARNVSLPAGAMRAIGYSRVIADARVRLPGLAIPPAISSQLLALPARGTFTTKSPAPPGMTNIIDFSNANLPAIRQILAHESRPADGLRAFIDANNLIQLGRTFSADIYSHHLFVAELAHEVVD